MISLKDIFKPNALNHKGGQLSKIIRGKLIGSDDECLIDFAGIPAISPLFFQEFIFPLVIEFGGHVLDSRLKLVNLNAEHLAAYQMACDQTSDYIDKLSAQQTGLFGDLSDITLELLLNAREMSRSHPSLAQAIFGLNSGMAASFAAMDIGMVRRIANAGIICFEPRLSPEFAARAAALDASEIDVFLNIAGGLAGVYELKDA
jgi:hypothetical protein